MIQGQRYMEEEIEGEGEEIEGEEIEGGGEIEGE